MPQGIPQMLHVSAKLSSLPVLGDIHITHKEHGQIDSKYQDEDYHQPHTCLTRAEAVLTGQSHDDHPDHICLSGPIFTLGPTVDQQPEDLTSFRSIVDPSLPIRRDILAPIGSCISKMIDISVQTEEIVDLSSAFHSAGLDLPSQYPYPPSPTPPINTLTK